ncbi:MAG: translesion DNA synthesis-associated protein ImuA [Proteobacteria bacterium]|nr:translesion DNA synthesis-associated protein ImuA [Pseudomonadota bacterium]
MPGVPPLPAVLVVHADTSCLRWQPARLLFKRCVLYIRPVETTKARLILEELPPAVWRGSDLGAVTVRACSSCWPELDVELPGGGFPARSITEILFPQPSVLEWRFLSGALRETTEAGKQVVVVGPPKPPHLPGLLRAGLKENALVWVRADAPAQRLWTTEQLIKGNSAGAIVAWLPQARAEQIRRLQVCALSCEAPVFLCRPEAARHDSSAAPLRLHVTMGVDWELRVNVFKRRGPAHVGAVRLRSVPAGLEEILTPRLQRPSLLLKKPETVDAVGSTAPASRVVDQLAVHE